MALPIAGHTGVISAIILEQLLPYLSFSQVFRSSCFHELHWLKMRGLVLEAEEIFLLVEAELNRFMDGDDPSG